MEDRGFLNFDINLQRLSMVKISVALWGSRNVKKDIQRFVENDYERGADIKLVEEKWCNKKFHEKVLFHMKSTGVPVKLQHELEQIIILMGKKIILWIDTVMLQLNYVKFLNRICWTDHGMVDEFQTFQVWKSDFIFCDYIAENFDNKLNYYFLACIYADVAAIKDDLQHIARTFEVCLNMKIKNHSRFKVISAMTVLLCFYFSIALEVEFKEVYSTVKSEKYPTGIDVMFSYCITHKLERAADYFYNKLKDEDKPGLVYKAALKFIDPEEINPSIHVEPDRIQKTIVYLLKKMPGEDLKKFLLESYPTVYCTILCNWPYLHLCVPMVNYLWNDLLDSDKSKVLEYTVHVFYRYKNYECVSSEFRFFHHEILENVLSMVPKDIKINAFADGSLIYSLFKNSQFLTIRKIVEDDHLKSIRSKLLTDFGKVLGEYLIRDGSSKNIENYMEQLQFTNEEKDILLKFCYDQNLLRVLIKRHFDSAKDVLKWQCRYNKKKITKRKKDMVKNELDFVRSVCSYCIGQSEYLGCLHRYLNWLSDGKPYKITPRIFSIDFIRENFFCLWRRFCGGEFIDTQMICSNFIEFVSISKCETKTVMKEKIVGEPEKFLKYIFDFDGVCMINMDQICKVLSIPASKIKKMKELVRENMDFGIESCPADVSQFLNLNSLINWVTTEEERNSIIKRHINTRKAAEFCMMASLYSDDDGVFNDAVELFFLEWVRPNGDIEKIKEHMKELDMGEIYNNCLPRAIKLLDLCKKDVKLFLDAINHDSSST